jgi:hypothetical protein
LSARNCPTLAESVQSQTLRTVNDDSRAENADRAKAVGVLAM